MRKYRKEIEITFRFVIDDEREVSADEAKTLRELLQLTEKMTSGKKTLPTEVKPRTVRPVIQTPYLTVLG